MLQQNTDQSGAAIVDDLFQRFLQAGAGFLRHVEELVLQSLIHQFMAGSCQRCLIPTASPGLLQKSPSKLCTRSSLCFSVPTIGADFGMDDGFHHMDGGCAGFQPDTVPSALPDDLRFLQRELLNAGHHDAVAGGFHLFQCTADLLVLPFCPGKLNRCRASGPLRRQFPSPVCSLRTR